jgi:translation initiation factor 1
MTVSSTRSKGTVFSTGKGRMCPKCGWPADGCRCSTGFDQSVPEKITARLRIEKAGRRGKTVTVVEGLPRNSGFLKVLAGELKRACATGGTVVEDRIEVQGDHRDGIRAVLKSKGWTVKG